MLAKFLLAITHGSPSLRRWLWKRWYQYLAGYRLSDWSFMNYGFERTGALDKWLELESADEPDRYCIQLDHQSHTPCWLSKTFEPFAGVQGSEIYELLRSGALVYRRHRLRN